MRVMVLHVGMFFHLGRMSVDALFRAENKFVIEQALVVDDEPDLLTLLHLDRGGQVQHHVAVLTHDHVNGPGRLLRITLFAESAGVVAKRGRRGRRDEGDGCDHGNPDARGVFHDRASSNVWSSEGDRVGERSDIPLTAAYSAGMTTSVSTVDDTMPPIIGTAIRCITSAPVPWLHMIGSRPAMMAATVIIFGRTRSTAPAITAP